MMRFLLTLVGMFYCVFVDAQGASIFLNKTVAEARFIADRSGARLTEVQILPDGSSCMMYNSTPPKNNNYVDLKMHNILFFSKETKRCSQILCTPSIQEKWVVDTLINRLKRRGFIKFDENTWTGRYRTYGEIISFEYERGYDANVNPLNLYFLQLRIHYVDTTEGNDEKVKK